MAEGIMADLGKSVTGNVESALLEIEDEREAKIRNAPSTKSGGILPSLSKGLKAAAKATKNEWIVNATDRALSQKPYDTYGNSRIFHVQFNPSELAIYGRRDEVYLPNEQAEGAKGTSDSPQKPKFLELSLNLIFDHVNIYDAFLFDKMTMGVSAAGVTNAVSAVSSSAEKTWSVQPEVEGLLAALRNPKTRKVTFEWNDFRFQGLLNDVSATYTMFSVSGRPIRARVEMRIHQDLSDQMISDWIKDFDAAFGDPENCGPKNHNDTSSYVRTQQKMGSLLNFDL